MILFNNDYNKINKLYSVILSEDEISILKLFSKKDDNLNISDRITIGAHKVLPKWMNEYSKDLANSNSKEARHRAAKKSAIIGGSLGALAGGFAGAKVGGIGGALGGAAIGAIGGASRDYLDTRVTNKLENKIRQSGGGGIIDDSKARQYDQVLVAQGKMSKSDFKNKWYRNRGNSAN